MNYHRNLVGNHITAIEETAFINSSINYIFLDDNQITFLDSAAFSHIKGFTVLFDSSNTLHFLLSKNRSLSSNFLSSLPHGVFDGLNEILSINLIGNKITSLHNDTLQDVFALRECVRNFVHFCRTSLLEIWLSANQLTEIPSGLLNGLQQLQVLFEQSNSQSKFAL